MDEEQEHSCPNCSCPMNRKETDDPYHSVLWCPSCGSIIADGGLSTPLWPTLKKGLL